MTGKLDLPAIKRGSTWRYWLQWLSHDEEPILLTGCDINMQIRSSVDSPVILVDLSLTNERITKVDDTGEIFLHIPHTITSFINRNIDFGVYDLEITHPSGEVTTLIEGSVEFSKEVTRK